MHNKAAAIVWAVLVANTPQLVLSMLYFSVNSLVTCMSLADEWGRFSHAQCVRNLPKTLRASDPVGQQRSTYFLQLPFRFAIPLIIVSALLHWLISQSIFVSIITIYDELGNLKENFAVTTCGFSPFAMILVIIGGILLALAIAGIGRMRLDPGMRVVGSCSAAISAACHVNAKTDEDRWALVQGPVVWGDTGPVATQLDPGHMIQLDDDEVRHATFASASTPSWSEQLSAPEEGKKYA